MAQSTRPPPIRHNSTVVASPPSLSPRTPPEKRPHLVRRKSGKEVVVALDKKSSSHSHRSAPLTRRNGPQHGTKGSAGWSGGKSKQQRDEEDDRRDSGESFPQFCMTCEKQFVPANNTFLYCSEHCRRNDASLVQPKRQNSIPSSISSISPTTPYFQAYSPSDGPDIIPRASPTQSRPRSYFNSEPYTLSYTYQGPSTYQQPTSSSTTSSNSTYRNSRSSTALASLRELATVLPKTGRTSDESSSTSPSISRTSSGVWNYISVPFSKPSATTPNITPQNSFNEKKYTTSSTSYGGYSSSSSGKGSREDLHVYTNAGAKSYGAAGYTPAMGGMGMGMDRPLPPRSGPGGYGSRARSIDLVTPVVQGQ